MGTGNKWGKWNTNEGLKLENRASTRGENEGVDGLRCLRRFRLERKKKKNLKRNLLSQKQADSKQRERKREECIRNRKRDSVNTGEEVEMSMRKQPEKERKGKES